MQQLYYHSLTDTNMWVCCRQNTTGGETGRWGSIVFQEKNNSRAQGFVWSKDGGGIFLLIIKQQVKPVLDNSHVLQNENHSSFTVYSLNPSDGNMHGGIFLNIFINLRKKKWQKWFHLSSDFSLWSDTTQRILTVWTETERWMKLRCMGSVSESEWLHSKHHLHTLHFWPDGHGKAVFTWECAVCWAQGCSVWSRLCCLTARKLMNITKSHKSLISSGQEARQEGFQLPCIISIRLKNALCCYTNWIKVAQIWPSL